MTQIQIDTQITAIKPYALGLIKSMGPVTIGQIQSYCTTQHKSESDMDKEEYFYYLCNIRAAVTSLIRDGQVELYEDTDYESVSFISA